MKIDLPCATPECVSVIAKYGDHYKSVHDVTKPPTHLPDATALCERCGGYHNGTEWKHVCAMCKSTVEPRQLRGLFVPSRCPACDDKVVSSEKARGAVCSRCKDVYSRCCC